MFATAPAAFLRWLLGAFLLLPCLTAIPRRGDRVRLGAGRHVQQLRAERELAEGAQAADAHEDSIEEQERLPLDLLQQSEDVERPRSPRGGTERGSEAPGRYQRGSASGELYAGLTADRLDHERLWAALFRACGRLGDQLGLGVSVRRLHTALVELGVGEDADTVPLPHSLERVLEEVRVGLGRPRREGSVWWLTIACSTDHSGRGRMRSPPGAGAVPGGYTMKIPPLASNDAPLHPASSHVLINVMNDDGRC